MNHSIYSADRATHLKIVIIALVAGTALSGLTIAGHSFPMMGRRRLWALSMPASR